MAKIKKPKVTEQYICVVCEKPIPPQRVEALKFLGTERNMWACVQHSPTQKVQGIFLQEAGTDLRVVRKVYNDSVRAVFRSSEEEKPAQVDAKEVENE